MSNRMPGHTLLNEGAAHNVRGELAYPARWVVGTGGTGYGKCSCGRLSGLLHSGNERKKWHRSHKEELRKESKKS